MSIKLSQLFEKETKSQPSILLSSSRKNRKIVEKIVESASQFSPSFFSRFEEDFSLSVQHLFWLWFYSSPFYSYLLIRQNIFCSSISNIRMAQTISVTQQQAFGNFNNGTKANLVIMIRFFTLNFKFSISALISLIFWLIDPWRSLEADRIKAALDKQYFPALGSSQQPSSKSKKQSIKKLSLHRIALQLDLRTNNWHIMHASSRCYNSYPRSRQWWFLGTSAFIIHQFECKITNWRESCRIWRWRRVSHQLARTNLCLPMHQQIVFKTNVCDTSPRLSCLEV